MECNKCHGWFENKYHPDNLIRTAEGDEEKLKITLNKNMEMTRKEVLWAL